MDKWLKYFENWGNRWRGILVVLGFFGLGFCILALFGGGFNGAVFLLVLLSLLTVSVKYIALGVVSAPVYKNKKAATLSYLAVLVLAVMFDVVVHGMALADGSVAGMYNDNTFQLAGLVAVGFLVFYAGFNMPPNKRGRGA